MWFLVLYNMHASNMVTIAPTHYLTTNDAIIESNVTLTEITECFFAMNLHLLAREIIFTIFVCAEYVHMVHLDVHLIRL